jgi:predicted DNA-binding transcriptional regulator AlpA
MSNLLDTRETAARAGLAPATLAKLRVRGGGPPFVKLGAKVLYPETELHAWLEALQRRTSTGGANAPKASQRRTD